MSFTFLFLRKQSIIRVMTASITITTVAEGIARAAILLELCSKRGVDSDVVQFLVFSGEYI